MQLHLTANTTSAFIVNALRENNVTRSAIMSNYVMTFEAMQGGLVKAARVADLASVPANFQSFVLTITGGTEAPNEGVVGLAVGDHTYRVYAATGATVADRVGEPLLSGWLTVHGDPTEVTQYTDGDNAPSIAYD